MQAISYGEFKENQQHLIEFKSQCSSLKSNVCISHNEIKFLIYQLICATSITVLIYF